MVNVVFCTLRDAALAANQYVSEPINRTEFPTDRLLFRCKGCKLMYTGSQVSPVDKLGHVCHGCQTRLAQMFLQ